RVFVVSQPGRTASAAALGRCAVGPDVAVWPGPTQAGGHAPPGGSSVMSIAPTILYALGVPMADDAAAPPMLDLFDADFVAKHPPRSISTYGERQRASRPTSGKALDQEMIDRLRSLGYVR